MGVGPDGIVISSEAPVLPAGFPHAMRFALAGARPNLSSSGLRIAIEFPDAAPAMLEVIRSTLRAIVAGTPHSEARAGRHVLSVLASRAPGAFVLRLIRGGTELTTPAVAIRGHVRIRPHELPRPAAS